MKSHHPLAAVFILLISLTIVSCSPSAPTPTATHIIEKCEKRIVADQDPDICQYQSDCESSCFYSCKNKGLNSMKENATFSTDDAGERWCSCACVPGRSQIVRG